MAGFWRWSQGMPSQRMPSAIFRRLIPRPEEFMSVRASTAEPAFVVRYGGREISHNLLFWPLQSVGWLLYGLMTLGYALARESSLQAGFDVVTLVVTGYTLTLIYRHLFRRWRRQSIAPLQLAALVVALTIASIPCWYESQVLLSNIVHSVRPSLVSSVPSYAAIPLYIWINFGFALLGWSLLYFSANGWISLERERRRAAAAEGLVQAARLQALQSQLQPHFLFNTLNSISALIVDGRLDAATSMISRLSDFLRISLQTSDTPLIPVASEVVFIRHYLDIQKIRFGDRLTFRLEVAPAAMSALVPTLLLQPLIENAVQHGVLPHREGGSVTIAIRTDARTLQLRIEDDGAGFRGSPTPPFGVGLSNTARRLDELYGDQAKLSIGRGAVSGVVVSIELPLVAARDQSVATRAQETA
ncbi:MAG: sensor histidine kinase [Steroidobacteraceae bacterium]